MSTYIRIRKLHLRGGGGGGQPLHPPPGSAPDSERPEIKVVISGNVLLFKDIKISLGLLFAVRKMHALFQENRCLEVSTTANNRIRDSAVKLKIPSKS